MQYTSSSFADMLVRLLGGALRPKTEAPKLAELFPAPSGFRSVVDDVVLGRIILPTINALKRLADRTHILQRGRMQPYVLYIFAAVVMLLLWTFPVGQRLARLLTR
jgi:hydrogenase-4 component B